MFKIFIAILLILSTKTDNNPLYDLYEKELTTIVMNIQSEISEITATANKGIATGSLFSSSQSLSVQTYTTTLNQVRNLISNLLDQSIIPYNLKTWNCTSVSDNEYNTLVNLYSQMFKNQQSLSDSLKSLSSFSNCPQVDEMNIQGKLLSEETQIARNQLSQFCSKYKDKVPAPISSTGTNVNNNINATNITNSNNTSGSTNTNTVKNATAVPNNTSEANGGSGSTTQNIGFVNNLDNSVNNWIYGNMNSQAFYADVNKKLQAGAKLCPSQNPYLDQNNNCISCPILYNVAAKKCASCPSGSSLNIKIHQCDTSSGETIIKNSNPSAINYIGRLPSPISNVSSCPTSAPYFDGNQCIVCEQPNYFDYTNSVCLTCGLGQQFDLNLKICKPLNNSITPQITKFNSNLAPNVVNYAGSPPASTNGLNNCPISQPYFNGMYCISCTLPLFFNFSSQVCSACDSSYSFDINTKNCILDPSKVYFTNSLNGVSNFIGNAPILADYSNKVTKPCPTQKPFSNGRQCMECSSPKFYNFQSNQCEKCSNNLIFSPQTKICEAKQANATTSKNSNIEKISNFMFSMPQYNESIETCDSNAPYFNGDSCIACNLPSYFNFKTFNCDSCPVDQTFNIQNRLCEFKDQKYISDMSNPNIYYNGNYQAYANIIDSKQQADSRIQICPSNTPFYQTTTNECINCPSDSPIFNVKYSKCISCGTDSSFDTTSRICIYNKKVGLSMQRALMNSFSL